MAAPLLKYALGNSASTTSSASVSNVATSIPLTSSTNFQAATVPGEGMALLDEGNATEELAYSTGLSGASLTTPLVNRGLEGGTAQAHSQSATVKGILSVGMWNDLITSLLNILDQTTGAIKTSLSLTTPRITTSINDSSGNEIIKTPATASAVNEVTITNAATGNPPIVSATGGDTNINLQLRAKGTGKIDVDAYFQTPQSYSPSGAGTATLLLAGGNDHEIIMPAGNITIALSDATVGMKFLVSILQDGGGSRTVTWFSTIRWAGGAPTLTTTGSKRDTFGFKVTGSGTYDGFIVGQNI